MYLPCRTWLHSLVQSQAGAGAHASVGQEATETHQAVNVSAVESVASQVGLSVSSPSYAYTAMCLPD